MAAEKPDIQAIFNEAVARDSDEQCSQYLDEMCGDDPQVRERVEALLRAHSEAGGFFGGRLSATEVRTVTEKPGTVIGPYKLLQQIGEGGMGVVYMAEQKEPVKRRVALKIIKPGMDTQQVIARFEAERQALAMMDHPNIAKVLDAGATDSGRPYFVMELVNGISVTQYCDEQHLTPKERLKLFLPICQALQHAHQKGIIHRDLKPSNVMIALYDDRAVPKVIDFGVAKATSQTLTEKTMFTQLGQIVGTLEYMSPEQAQRNQLDIDTRSDIYSLGVLLYELLTGDTPFDRQRLRSAAFDEMLRIIREAEPLKPSTKVSGSESLPAIAANRKIEPAKLSVLVRGELDWIVMKALEKDRGRRYATATSFAEDIQHYLNDEAVVACPPSARYRFRKFVRRNRPLIATGALVTAALVLGLVGTTWQAIRANNQSLRASSAEILAKQRLEREQDSRKQVSLERDKALASEKAADSRFQIASEAVERYLDEVANDPELQSGNFHELRKRLLESAVPFYEKLIEEKPQDRDQRSAQGTAHGKLWRLEYYNFSNFDAARSHAEQALDIFERLSHEVPSDHAIRSQLASSHTQMGIALNQLGDREQSRHHHELALDISRQLAEEFPEESDYQSQLATHYGNWANYVDDSEETKYFRQKSVEIFERLRSKFPDSRDYADKLAFFLNNMPDLPELQRSLEIREILVRDFPDVQDYRDRVADSLDTIGGWNKKRGTWEQAHQHYGRALALRAELAREFSIPDYKFKLAKTHNALGNLHQTRMQTSEADEHFGRALPILESLATELRQVAQYRVVLTHVHCEIGKARYREGEWQAALESLKKADELKDGELEHHRFFMAMAHWQLRDVEQARTCYWEAVTNTGQLGDAELLGFRDEAENVLGIDAKERNAYLIKHYAELIAHNPEDRSAFRARGNLHKYQKQWAKAIDDYSSLIRLNANDTNAYRDRYACYRATGEYDAALKDITRAIELKPDYEWFYDQRAVVRIFHLDQVQEGIADCNRALRINPQNRNALLHRAMAHQELEEYEAAVVDAVGAIKLDPNYQWGWTELTKSVRAAQTPAELAALDQLPEYLDKDAETFAQRAESLADKFLIRAKLYANNGDSEKALADCETARRLAPETSNSFNRLGFQYARAEKWTEALAVYLRRVEIDPENFNAIVWIRSCLLLSGDIEGYRKHCRGLLDRYDETKSETIAQAVAECFATQAWPTADLERPMALAKLVADRSEADAGDQYRYGAILYRAGRYEEALKRLTEAFESQRDDPDGKILFFLAMTNYAMGDAEQAQQFLEHGEKWLNERDSSGKPIPALLHAQAKQLFSEAEKREDVPTAQASINNVN